MDYLNRLLITTFLMIAIAGCSQKSDRPENPGTQATIEPGMLQHTVFFYLKEDVTAEDRQQFEEGLKKLLAIEEVYNYQIGIPGKTAERDVTDHSFGYSFFSWFETLEDYKVYAEHPVHMEFIDEYEDLWADVQVYDSEIIAKE